MTTTEATRANHNALQLYEDNPPPTADAIYDCMEMLAPDLEKAKHELAKMGLAGVEVMELPTETDHHLLVVDASLEPGGAFKFNGAAFGLWSLLRTNPGLKRVTTGTAGSFGAALSKAGEYLGVDVMVHSHSNLNPDNERTILLSGGRVDASHTTIMDAIAAARTEAELDPQKAAFMHPFNNPYCIKGQQLVGEQLARVLLEREAAGLIDLQRDNVSVLVQRAGGSLLGSTALEVKRLEYARVFGSNVQVHDVRPQRRPDGSLDQRYDKLLVEEPGSWAKPVIEDPRFVHGHHEVNVLDTARAAARLAKVTSVEYEFSALAGLAAAEKLLRETVEPTTFVAILSGRNPAPGTYSHLHHVISRLKENLTPPAAAVSRAVGSALLSGSTAAYRQGMKQGLSAVKVSEHKGTSGAFDAYYSDLEDQGVTLITRQH